MGRRNANSLESARTALMALAVMAAALAAPAAASEKKVEEYLQAFWTAALWKDSGATGSSTMPVVLSRFPDSTKLRIALGGPMGEAYRNQVVSRIGPVLTSAKIDFEILPTGQDSGTNVQVNIITFIPNTNFGAPCVTARRPPTGATRRATLDILDTRVVDCMAHEMMHALGFPGHPHDSNSILSYVNKNTNFTEIDRMIVRVLYHPRLQPGMNHLTAIATARDVLVDLMIADGAPAETREYGRRFVSIVPAAFEKLIADNRANKLALAHARYQLGLAYTFGTIVTKDEATGYRYLREAAEALPDPDMLFFVAYALRVGRGTAANRAESMEWYKKAATRGHRGAQNDLGYYFHWKSEGAEKDLIEAYKWFTIAAERGQQQAPRNRADVLKELSNAELEEAVRRVKAWRPAGDTD